MPRQKVIMLPVAREASVAWSTQLAAKLQGQQGHFLVLLGQEQQLVSLGSSFVTALQAVQELAAGRVTSWWRYSLSQGLTNLAGESIPWVGTVGNLAPSRGVADYDQQANLRLFLTAALRRPAIYHGRLALIINNLPLLIPERGQAYQSQEVAWLETLHAWISQDEQVRQSGNLILAWVERREEVPSLLRALPGSIAWQELPLPDQVTRARFVLRQQTDNKQSYAERWQSAQILAQEAEGLSLQELSCVLSDQNHHSQPLHRRRQENILAAAGDVVSVVEANLPLEQLGGLSLVRPYLLSVLQRFRAGRSAGSLLFMGPPGTGKTAVAAALAQAVGLLCLAPYNLREKWVGASERNLERLLAACLRYAPVVLFLDELDLNLGKRTSDNDSGVNNRLFQRLLTLLSDPSHSQKVMVIAATNWPDQLDRALIRAGRFQAKVPFFLPTLEERVEILQRQLQRQVPSAKIFVDVWQHLAKQAPLAMASGADLALLVATASQRAEQLAEQLQPAHLAWALQELILVHDRVSLELMTLLAVQHTTHRSFLPDQYRCLLEGGQLEMAIQQLQNSRPGQGG